MIEKINIKEFNSLQTGQENSLPTVEKKGYLTQSDFKDLFTSQTLATRESKLFQIFTSFIYKILEKCKTFWSGLKKPVQKKETFIAHGFLKSVNNHQILPGNKTVSMLEALEFGALPGYNAKKAILKHNGTDYHILQGANENISLAPVMCIGSNPTTREIISLNPKNSPVLQSKYQELVGKLYAKAQSKETKSLSAKESLEFISSFVKNEVFSTCTEYKVFEFIEKWKLSHKNDPSCFILAKNGTNVPVIDIDTLIKGKIGVCRHLSLVTAFFLDQMRRDPDLAHLLPRGKSYYVRSQLARGGHAWNLYIPNGSSRGFHVDSLWGVVKDCSKAEDLDFLYHAYGKTQIEGVFDRFLRKKAS